MDTLLLEHGLAKASDPNRMIPANALNNKDDNIFNEHDKIIESAELSSNQKHNLDSNGASSEVGVQ